jgi:hypothetical protein
MSANYTVGEMGMFLNYFKTGIFVCELSCRQIGIRQSWYEFVTRLTTLNTVLKMEFVVSKRVKTMLHFDGFKYVFDYMSQTNVILWRCFMKNCRINIFKKKK